MSRGDTERLHPEQLAAREAVRGLCAMRPDGEYREGVKQRFLAGFPDEPAETPRRPQLLQDSPPTRRTWLVRAAGLVAAIGLVWAATRLFAPEQAWELAAASGSGDVMVDGRAVPIDDAETLAACIQPGCRLSVESDSALELVGADQMILQVAPDTELTVPRRSLFGGGRRWSAEVARGTVRITTGEGFEGGRLEVRAGQLQVEVTGTTLAVMVNEDYSRVCVLEGRVRIGLPGEEMAWVEGGQRHTFFHDGGEHESGEILPSELERLRELLEDRKPAVWQGE